jgi:hypothetical protein
MKPLAKSLGSKKSWKCPKIMFDEHLLTNGTCTRKLTYKNPRKVPHMCLAKNPLKNKKWGI